MTSIYSRSFFIDFSNNLLKYLLSDVISFLEKGIPMPEEKNNFHLPIDFKKLTEVDAGEILSDDLWESFRWNSKSKSFSRRNGK